MKSHLVGAASAARVPLHLAHSQWKQQEYEGEPVEAAQPVAVREREQRHKHTLDANLGACQIRVVNRTDKVLAHCTERDSCQGIRREDRANEKLTTPIIIIFK